MTEPLHIISLGAGVQSSTMALMAAHGEITPMPSCAIFADTGAEPRKVYEWLDWLEKQLPFPVHRVNNGSLTEDSLQVRFSKKSQRKYLNTLIPLFVKSQDGSTGVLRRACTSDYKIDPINRFIRETVPAPSYAERRNTRAIVWIGISRDEIERVKESQKPYIKHIWPLIEKRMTRSDCLAWMRSMRFPEPPRSACIYCPYHSDSEWMRLKAESPEEFAEAALFEQKIHALAGQQEALVGLPYLHRSCVPLDKINFQVQEQFDMWDMRGECEGMCGM